MPRTRQPRKGSMQFWPRKRAKKENVRIRHWHEKKDATLLGFPGYKAGMTQITIEDNYQNSLTKGANLVVPATVIECPPIKVVGTSFYKKTPYGLQKTTSIMSSQADKELSKTIPLPKKSKKIDDVKPESFDLLRLIIHTQPKFTGIGKKKPELFEMGLSGTKEQQIEQAKQFIDKEVKVNEVFKEGQQIDAHAVSKGKGYQGPVKRFGVAIRHHKSEKTKRGPGSLGPWHGPEMNRVAHAGQMGYHTRLDCNKLILKIENSPEKINPKGGFIRFGQTKNTCLLIKGSLPGPKKRLIKLTHAQKPNRRIPVQPPKILQISTYSQM